MKSRLLTGVLLAAVSLTAGAADEPAPPPEFDVEVIVFRHLYPDETERPPEFPVDEPMADEEQATEDGFTAQQTDPEPESEPEPEPEIEQVVTPLPAEALRLEAINQRLLRSREWSPVLHYAWRQSTLGRDDAEPVAIAGNRLDAFTSGTVRLSLERFLRLEFVLEMDPGTGVLYTLDQARRLRSGELHYFDHPQFGVIALVSRTDE